MSIVNTTNTIREAGNGSKTEFDFPFTIYNTTDLKVYKILNSTGVRTLQVLNTDYTVEISTSAEGGTVTFTTAPSSLQDSFIERDLPYTQATNIPAVGGIREEQLEKGLDKLCILVLQLLKKAQLALKFVSSSEQSDMIVPEPEADQVLGWNAAGDALENKTLEYTAGTFPGAMGAGADASKAASPGANAIYIATDTGRVYVCYTAGTWTDITGLCAIVDIASATTTNIGAVVGKYLRITGTTTITGLGTATDGTVKVCRFAAALTLTHNATSLILPGGASITTAAGDIAEFVSEGGGNWRCLQYLKASGVAIVPFSPTTANALSGSQIDLQTNSIATVVTCSTAMPNDDTIPQSGEGTEVVTVSITPKHASNVLEIFGYIPCGATAAGPTLWALFQDAVAGAIAAGYGAYLTTNETGGINFYHKMLAGTTSATTFKVRIAGVSATLYVNAGTGSASRSFGGVQKAWIAVRETKA